jgi:hypothetical protein
MSLTNFELWKDILVKQRILRVSFAKEARHGLVDRYPPGLTRGQIDLGRRSVYVWLAARGGTASDSKRQHAGDPHRS